MLTAQQWLNRTTRGFCGATQEGESDCTLGDMGAFGLSKAEATSWAAAATVCLQRCGSCERCAFISVSIKFTDCSWYSSCDLARSNGEHPSLVHHFRSAAVHAVTNVSDPPPPVPAAGTWPELHLRAPGAVALQMSGHLKECNLASVAAHLRHCRERFERCDLFVHTWARTSADTAHWSGRRYNGGRNEPSDRCVARIRAELQPTAMVVERQRQFSPSQDSVAPDGLPFTRSGLDRAIHWGASRHFGWKMNLHGMSGAAELRLRHEARGAISPASSDSAASPPRGYLLSVRVRPDGQDGVSSVSGNMEDAGMEKMLNEAPVRTAIMWDCLALAAAADDNGRGRSIRGGRGGRGGGGSSGSNPRAAQWRHHAARSINTCGPSNGDGLGDDNCYWGTPAHTDDLLRQFATNYTATWRAMSAARLAHAHPEFQFKVASAAAGLGMNYPCHPRKIYLARLVPLAASSSSSTATSTVDTTKRDGRRSGGRRRLSALSQPIGALALHQPAVGFCNLTKLGGDCAHGASGAWTLKETSSWPAAAAACLRLCARCEGCRFVSISVEHEDCSWFRECDLARLNGNVKGFVSGAMRHARHGSGVGSGGGGGGSSGGSGGGGGGGGGGGWASASLRFLAGMEARRQQDLAYQASQRDRVGQIAAMLTADDNAAVLSSGAGGNASGGGGGGGGGGGDDGTDLLLALGVLSTPQDGAVRQYVRHTLRWQMRAAAAADAEATTPGYSGGSGGGSGGNSHAKGGGRLAYRFLLGGLVDDASVERELRRERRHHGDLCIFGDVRDGRPNGLGAHGGMPLAAKSLSWMLYAAASFPRARFVGKTDTDTLVVWPRVRMLLRAALHSHAHAQKKHAGDGGGGGAATSYLQVGKIEHASFMPDAELIGALRLNRSGAYELRARGGRGGAAAGGPQEAAEAAQEAAKPLVSSARMCGCCGSSHHHATLLRTNRHAHEGACPPGRRADGPIAFAQGGFYAYSGGLAHALAAAPEVEAVRRGLARGGWQRIANKEDVVVAYVARAVVGAAALMPVGWGKGLYHDIDGGINGSPLGWAVRCLSSGGGASNGGGGGRGEGGGGAAARAVVVEEANMTTGTKSRWGTPESVYPTSAIVHRISSGEQMRRGLALALAWQAHTDEWLRAPVAAAAAAAAAGGGGGGGGAAKEASACRRRFVEGVL